MAHVSPNPPFSLQVFSVASAETSITDISRAPPPSSSEYSSPERGEPWDCKTPL